MFQPFLIKPWIKNKVLSYLFNEEEYNKSPVRAQILRFMNSKEELEPNEFMSAEIHDMKHYIKCFFANEGIDDFEREDHISIDDMRGGFIIIKDYTISYKIDYPSKNRHECFLTINKFALNKNITEEQEESLKYICEEMEVKETLRAKDYKSKPNHFDHPGWNGFKKLFYSNAVDIRTVPPDQRRIMNNIPGWNFSQRNNVKDESSNSKESSPAWSPSSPEPSQHDSDGAISLNDEDIAIITKGNYNSQLQNAEREINESYRRDDDEIHFEQNKRKYNDSDLDDDTISKKQKVSSQTPFITI